MFANGWGAEMGACVPYVVQYTEMVVREAVVYAVTADEAAQTAEEQYGSVGFGEVVAVSLQQDTGG